MCYIDSVRYWEIIGETGKSLEILKRQGRSSKIFWRFAAMLKDPQRFLEMFRVLQNDNSNMSIEVIRTYNMRSNEEPHPKLPALRTTASLYSGVQFKTLKKMPKSNTFSYHQITAISYRCYIAQSKVKS